MNRFITLTTAVVLTVLVAAPAAGGQRAAVDSGQAPSVDQRWLPWIGCWRPASQRSPEEGVHICVVPASANGARVMTIAGDQAVIEETIVPDGMEQAVIEPSCRGTRRSEWSADGQRIFSSAELACDTQAPRKVSGLSVLTAEAEWIDIQVVMAGAQENVRVRRYQRSNDRPPDPSLIPEELAVRAARSALGTRLSVNHIIEASAKVTPRVLEALLFQTKANFAIDSRQLLAMDDGGVADTVIDLMVAFSFPKKFEVRRSVGGSSLSDGFGWGGFGFGGLGLSAEYASTWYYNPYYSYFSPFGYQNWNYWDGYYYGPGSGVIIGGSGEGGAQPSGHGRVVNGSGYTQVVTRTPENEGQAAQRLRSNGGVSDAGASSSGGSSGGSSGVSSGGYSSGGGGGDSGRTAIPR